MRRHVFHRGTLRATPGCRLRIHVLQRPAILRAGLASPSIRHAGLGHEIPFIAGIHEDLRRERLSVLCDDFSNARSLLANTALFAPSDAERKP